MQHAPASGSVISSSCAIACWSDEPPQSKTRVNSEVPPPETSSEVDSWPIATTTVAVSVGGAEGEPLRLDECPQQRERLEIDAAEPDSGGATRVDEGLDLVARGDDEQHAADDLPAFRHALVYNAVVEDRLVDRDREHLVGLEPDGVVESLLVVDPRDVERADTDAVARDADPDVLLRKLVLGEEDLSASREGSASRTSPSTTIPGSSGVRASPTSS